MMKTGGSIAPSLRTQEFISEIPWISPRQAQTNRHTHAAVRRPWQWYYLCDDATYIGDGTAAAAAAYSFDIMR